MSFLLILLILAGLLAFGLKEWFQYKLGCAPQAVAFEVRQNLIRICNHFGRQGSFLDVGSAWGTNVLHLAKAVPEWQFDGVEKSPTPWLISQLRSALFRFKNYRLFLADAKTWPLADYDIIFVNISNSQLRLLHSRLKNYADAGTVVILLNKQFKDFPNHQEIEVDAQHKLHMYLLLPEMSETNDGLVDNADNATPEMPEPAVQMLDQDIAFVDPSPAQSHAPVPPAGLTLADMAAHIGAEK